MYSDAGKALLGSDGWEGAAVWDGEGWGGGGGGGVLVGAAVVLWDPVVVEGS